jgi:hypothetical protein
MDCKKKNALTFLRSKYSKYAADSPVTVRPTKIGTEYLVFIFAVAFYNTEHNSLT